MPAEPRRAGQLVAARSRHSRTGIVHASPLLIPQHDPSRGLVPWDAVAGCAAVLLAEVADPVNCRSCLRWMDRRGLKIGDIADA